MVFLECSFFFWGWAFLSFRSSTISASYFSVKVGNIEKSREDGSVHSYVLENENNSETRGWAPAGQARGVSWVGIWEVPSSSHHTTDCLFSWSFTKGVWQAVVKRDPLRALLCRRGVVKLLLGFPLNHLLPRRGLAVLNCRSGICNWKSGSEAGSQTRRGISTKNTLGGFDLSCSSKDFGMSLASWNIKMLPTMLLTRKKTWNIISQNHESRPLICFCSVACCLITLAPESIYISLCLHCCTGTNLIRDDKIIL